MDMILRPTLELTVIIPGILLAYLPVKTYLKQQPLKLAAWLLPLLAVLCVLGGAVCCKLQITTLPVLFFLLSFVMVIYHSTLHITIWKSGSIFLAVCAVFACVNSLSRAVNAILTEGPDLTENELWFRPETGLFYNGICLFFLLAAWYPASHTVRVMVTDEHFAHTWYVFWVLPLIFIGLNLFMIPKYRNTLYTGRILQGYIVVSLILLLILVLFYAMFLLMAYSLNKNARLVQENHFLSLQQTRYENLCTAIEETRHARHDMRHHFLQLSSLAEREKIPFHAKTDLPAHIAIDEIDMCLILSNLLENALQASRKTESSRRKINVTAYLHHNHLLLIQVENTFDDKIEKKNDIFQSSKRPGNGIGIQSVRHIAEKNGGSSNFTFENGVFTAQIMLRLNKEGEKAS